ncbi:glycoside hydrolase 100 family protein [Kaarinaea lacus]
MPMQSAYELLEKSLIYYRGQAVGTAAACDESVVAANYNECFVRDFVPSALVFLMNGRHDIVRNFLVTVMQIRGQQKVMKGHKRSRGLMPASFHIIEEAGVEEIVADFGDRAIGRVTPVDSAMWWMILLRAYVVATDDWELVHSDEVQQCIKQILELYLRESFASSPTLLVPDAAFMIDRRMAVYGYPLENQALYFGLLVSARELLNNSGSNAQMLENLEVLSEALKDHLRVYYWLDRERLNEMHRYYAEEFGLYVVNVLNVYPESIPDWMDGWLDSRCGYLVGNVGPGRVDFRYFALGNLLAILFGLTTAAGSQGIMNLYQRHWNDLVGEMPVKIAFPAMTGEKWRFSTGSDPKNVSWSYHNGGNWPVLVWPFVASALRTGRLELAEQALNLMTERLKEDKWPEYYDGRNGGLIGRRANFFQVWSATGLIIAHELMENPESRALFDKILISQPSD